MLWLLIQMSTLEKIIVSLSPNTLPTCSNVFNTQQLINRNLWFINELPHDKTNKMSVRPEKTQISLGIRPV